MVTLPVAPANRPVPPVKFPVSTIDRIALPGVSETNVASPQTSAAHPVAVERSDRQGPAASPGQEVHGVGVVVRECAQVGRDADALSLYVLDRESAVVGLSTYHEALEGDLVAHGRGRCRHPLGRGRAESSDPEHQACDEDELAEIHACLPFWVPARRARAHNGS